MVSSSFRPDERDTKLKQVLNSGLPPPTRLGGFSRSMIPSRGTSGNLKADWHALLTRLANTSNVGDLPESSGLVLHRIGRSVEKQPTASFVLSPDIPRRSYAVPNTRSSTSASLPKYGFACRRSVSAHAAIRVEKVVLPWQRASALIFAETASGMSISTLAQDRLAEGDLFGS